MIAVKTYATDMEAEKAVLLLRRAGVSGFAKAVSASRNDDFSSEAGVQVRVVEDAALKAHQILDVFA